MSGVINMIFQIIKGEAKITKFKETVGEGDKLWDEGWRINVKKIGPIKFLVWTKASETSFEYGVKDVAKKFDVTPETVRRWCREEKIRFIKLPGRKGGYRFSKEDIEEFVNNQKS